MGKPTITRNALAALIIFFVFSSPAAFAADDFSGLTDTPSQIDRAEQPSKTEKAFDHFGQAILLLGIGCMVLSSSVHWALSQKKRIGTRMAGLSAFIAGNCCVSFTISGHGDADPMEATAKGLLQEKEEKVAKLNEDRDAEINAVSKVETALLRLWG